MNTKKMRHRRMVAVLGVLSLVALAVMPWPPVNGNDGAGRGADPPWSNLSLEGIWTTMMDGDSICSLVVSAQGSEGMVYTVVGKHPQCPPNQGDFFPEASRVSDMLGYFVRVDATTFRFSVIFHGIKDDPVGGLGEILYMITLNGTGELIDKDTLVLHESTGSAYVPAQNANGDRLPDEGAEPLGCVPMGELTFKRVPMFPACEPTAMPQSPK